MKPDYPDGGHDPLKTLPDICRLLARKENRLFFQSHI